VVGLPPAATRPYFVNPTPADVVEGSFSVPHLFACMAHGLPVGPAWHTAESLHRPDLAVFRQRVEVAVDPRSAEAITAQVTAGGGASIYRACPTSLRVETRDGVLELSADYASGDPWTAETRLSNADLEAKFLAFTESVLGAEGARSTLGSVRRLPAIPDVRDLQLDASGPNSSTTRSEELVAVDAE
jgi:2-methylcitrate dehydratase PrpD